MKAVFYAINLKKIIRRTWPLAVILLLAFIALVLLRLFPLSHLPLINKYAEKYGLEPAFVCAVIHAESRFRPSVSSPKGASGLMQLTEPTATWLAGKMKLDDFDFSQIYDPDTNINIGCYNLQRLIGLFDGSEELALAAYNAGEGSVGKWLKDPRFSHDGKTLASIPFQETREYIARVRLNMKIYKKILWFTALFAARNE